MILDNSLFNKSTTDLSIVQAFSILPAPVITKTIIGNVSTINLEQTFTYAIDIAFSGIIDLIPPSHIIDEFPNYIEVLTVPSALDLPLLNISCNSTPSGATKLILYFGVVDPGQSLHFEITCRFKKYTKNCTSFTNTLNYYETTNPDLIITTATSHTITLQLTANLEISKSLVVPQTPPGPTPGGTVLFSIIIKNIGDAGALINGVNLTDLLPNKIDLDTSFPAIGEDITPNPYFQDSSQNTTFNTSNGILTIALNNYYGTEYRVIFRAFINDDINLIGENTTNIVIGGQTPIATDITISEPVENLSLRKYGPDHASPGNLINYEIYIGNAGNVDLKNVFIEDFIPDDVNIYKVSSGSYSINLIDFYPLLTTSIYYTTNINPVYKFLGTSSYNTDKYFSITLPTGERITKVKWKLPNIYVGVSCYNGLKLWGTIDSSTHFNKIITNNCKVSWNNGKSYKTITYNTQVDGISSLCPYKDNSPNGDVNTESIITYTLIADADFSQLNNPIFIDILPPQVDFVEVTSYEYYDFFTETHVISLKQSDFPNNIIIPPKPTITHYGTNQTLIKFPFTNSYIPQRGFLKIYFTVKVKVGAIGTITNNYILGNTGNQSINSPISHPYIHNNYIYGDKSFNTIMAISNNVINNVIFSTKVKAVLFVKGAYDEEYCREPDYGHTYQGGSINYKLILFNNGNTPLLSTEIIDILPHINDTGIIVDTPRESQYHVYNIYNVTAKILNSFNESIGSEIINVLYNNTYTPPRFDSYGNDIEGTGVWTLTPPNPITLTGSFKIYTDISLYPGETIEIDVYCLSPYGVTDEQISWNSFTYKVSYIDKLTGEKAFLLPAEPRKVGVSVDGSNPNVTSIGNYVWNDLNENGIQDEPPSAGLNGVTVSLFTSQDKQYGNSTVTTNDINGNPGYYLFNNLTPGSYYVMFHCPTGYKFTTKYANKTDINSPNNSKADEKTGKTDIIYIESGIPNLIMDAGFIKAINMYSLSGCIYNNCSGTPDSEDSLLTDVSLTIAITEIKTGKTIEITTNTGKYTFQELHDGNCFIVEIKIPNHYDLSYSPEEAVCIECSNITNVNFGLCKQGSISGSIYNNCNGVSNDNNSLVTNVPITLTISEIETGEILKITTENGNYSFKELYGGNCYNISLTLPPGYNLTYAPNNLICINSSTITEVNFGLCKSFSICGSIYETCCDKPKLTPPLVCNIPITITIKNTITGKSDTIITTTGKYCFDNLPPCTCYDINITVPTEYYLSYCPINPICINTCNINNIDFGLCKLTPIITTVFLDRFNLSHSITTPVNIEHGFSKILSTSNTPIITSANIDSKVLNISGFITKNVVYVTPKCVNDINGTVRNTIFDIDVRVPFKFSCNISHIPFEEIEPMVSLDFAYSKYYKHGEHSTKINCQLPYEKSTYCHTTLNRIPMAELSNYSIVDSKDSTRYECYQPDNLYHKLTESLELSLCLDIYQKKEVYIPYEF